MKKEVERRIVRRTIRELWDRVDDGDGVLTKQEARRSRPHSDAQRRVHIAGLPLPRARLCKERGCTVPVAAASVAATALTVAHAAGVGAPEPGDEVHEALGGAVRPRKGLTFCI